MHCGPYRLLQAHLSLVTLLILPTHPSKSSELPVMAVDPAVVSEEVAAETSFDTWGLVGTRISHFGNVTPAREMIGHCKIPLVQ